MNIEIVPINHEHIHGFFECLDSVARVRKYLCFLQAPPLESVSEFVDANIAARNAQFVALDGGRVVGWCDVIPKKMEGFQHVGVLGMGLLPDYRGQGIGTRLIETTLSRAKEIGLERIELDAFATNTNAIALYEKVGFVIEGVKRNARKIDGIVEDNIVMGLLI